jgi:hypothetical protein
VVLRKTVVLLVLLVWTGCARKPGPLSVDPGQGAPADLSASLAAKVSGDTITFTLRVMNTTNGPVRIEFPTAQRYDFEVGTTVGERVWQWSADRGFGQALGSVTLRSGESAEYSEAWRGGRPGEYYVLARLASTNKPVELRTGFTIPSR